MHAPFAVGLVVCRHVWLPASIASHRIVYPPMTLCLLPNAAYCNVNHLWPAGFTSEWEDEKGVRFVNSITETPSGPVFRWAGVWVFDYLPQCCSIHRWVVCPEAPSCDLLNPALLALPPAGSRRSAWRTRAGQPPRSWSWAQGRHRMPRTRWVAASRCAGQSPACCQACVRSQN